jgi:hypothetical protein
MRQTQIFLLLSIVFLSCKPQPQVKFVKEKWQATDDPAAPPQSRKDMLKDLLSSYKLEGMSRSKIIELSGESDYKEDSSMAYKIEEEYGSDIDPVYTKTLQVRLGDTIVKAVDVLNGKNNFIQPTRT